MSGTHVTWTGNLTRDPEVRFSKNGNAWATFALAIDHYVPNAKSDVETTFVNVKVLNSELASNVAESLKKGNRVSVAGQIKVESWSDKEGHPRTSMVLVASDVAVSLKWAIASPRPAGKPSSTVPATQPSTPVAPAAASAGTQNAAPF